MNVTINDRELNFKIKYKRDSYKNKTITFEVKADRLMSFYDWEKVQEFIEEVINK